MTARSKSHSPASHRRTPPKSRTDSQKATDPAALLSKETLRAFVITLCIGGMMLLLTSLSAYFHSDPATIILPLGLLSAAVTAFFGGFAAGRLKGKAPAVCGMINGLLLTAVMLLLSFCLMSESSHHSALVSTLLHSAVPLLSVLGAMVGVKKPSAPKRRR